MPEGGPTPLVRPGKGIARGAVTRHEFQSEMLTASKKRTVYLYKPPTESLSHCWSSTMGWITCVAVN